MDKLQREKPKFTYLTAFFSRPLRREIVFAEDLQHAATQLEISFKKPASKNENETFILIEGDSAEELTEKIHAGVRQDSWFIGIQFQESQTLTAELMHLILKQAECGKHEFALIGLTPEQKNNFSCYQSKT